MTIAKNIVAKASVAFVATAMIFTMFAPAAQAQSAEELQKMINDLLAQVAALQAQTGQGATSVPSGVCPFTWTRDLGPGSTGADVMKLQQFLNADVDTRVAAAGAGSVGMETEFYGPATAAAVSKMQVKYRAEVLSPAGLVNPTGYFGPASRAKANAVCAMPTTPTTPTTPGDEDEDEDNGGPVTLGGEATLETFEIDSAPDDEIEEGSSDAVAAEVTIQFEDGDAEISRMDVSFDKSGSDPWDVLESVSLWVDGEMIAEMDASDEDDYQDEDDGTLRFIGLDLVGMEDEDLEVLIGVTLQNNVDSGDLGNWNVSVDSIRYFDADGVAETDTTTDEIGDNVTFEIVEAGDDDEIVVRTSSADPESTTIQLEDDRKSSWITVFAFDLDTDDSKNDITVDTMPVTITVANDSFGDIVSDLQLVVDGQEFDDWSYATGTAASTTVVVEFDIDGDLEIEAGDRVTAELQVEFKSLATEGATIQGSVTGNNADNIDAEGVDDVEELSGSATGDVHTLRSEGISVVVEDADAAITTQDGNLNDYATFTMDLEVTAFEQDVFISTTPGTSINYILTDGTGATTTGFAASSTVVVTSSGDENGGYFEINEGETETITVKVTYVPNMANTQVRMQLQSIEFNDSADTPDQEWFALPANDFRTSVVTVVN